MIKASQLVSDKTGQYLKTVLLTGAKFIGFDDWDDQNNRDNWYNWDDHDNLQL